jgi:cytochrome c oxidase accessory protein FixG
MNPSQKAPSRDTVTTINNDGSRYFIHTADVHGFFTTARRIFGWALIVFFIALPWIPVNGHPALFLDTATLQFHIFGLTFFAQDMWLAFFLITGLGFSLFYITSLFGRIWCGWACPQTVFLETIFRRIERLVDGDAIAQRKLDESEWDATKIFKRLLKHSLYFIFALAVAHIFLAYFISLPALYDAMTHSPTQNFSLFMLVFVMGAALYFDFAWFREQFCIILCPYGRFQSALIDDNSVVIGYDEKRGEPRGKDQGAGDCIDCRRCVHVCPTGIDIRQGLQMECIGCSNCVDACDEVMTKLNRPKGLVRYDSLNGLNGAPTKIVRPRTIIYTILMIIGALAMLASFSTFRTVGIGLTRIPGSPFFLSEGQVRNQYMVRVLNKASEPRRISLKVSSPEHPALTTSGFPESIEVPAEGEVQQLLVLLMPQKNFPGTLHFTVTVSTADGKSSAERTAEFLGPDPENAP